MKKKIFIFSHAMEIGGAERSLIEMLNCFDYERFDVDLFLLRHQGDWLNEIPEEVNLLPEIHQYTGLMTPIVNLLKEKKYGVLFGRFIGKQKANHYNKKHNVQNSYVAIDYSHKFTKAFMPNINPDTEYDLAISFLTPHYFVAEKVNAKKKIAWIHTDYSTIGIDVKSELAVWSKFDYIASISDDCTKGFLTVFPSLKDKIVKIENLLSEKTVLNKADEAVEIEYDITDEAIILLTIGRFTPQKKLFDVPEIVYGLLKKGLNIKWYLIGFGTQENLIREKIKQYNVEESVIILGKRDNPYPYIKACDIYAQPSLYEGKSVTVREAQMLAKPVIITNYPTAKAQLTNGYDGIIVPLEIDDCIEELYNVLSNKALLNEISENTKKEDYTNKIELEKLYSVVD